MSRKLIIGCGYLGERVAHRWLAEGSQVAALTRSAERAREFERSGIEPIVGDVLHPGSLESLPAADAILYSVGFDRTSGKSQREVYVSGLENVLAHVAPRVQRLVYVSSVSVYGQSNGEVVDETSECRPTRENGCVCLDAEAVVRRLFPSDCGASACVLRLAGIYGPGRLLHRIDALRSGEPIAGDPEGFLNLIHVDDAAASILACEQRGKSGETYIVSDDRPVRRREYYQFLASRIDAPPPTFAGAAARTEGLNKRCSNRKLRQELAVELRYPTYVEGITSLT